MTASGRAASAVRVAVGLATASAGAWLLLNTARFRTAEAWSMEHLVDATLAGRTYRSPGSSTVFVGLGTSNGIGLRIDQLCSTGAIAGLMAVLTGSLVVFAGLRVHRAWLGLAAMVGLLGLVNAVRLTALSWSVTRYGLTGWFEWLHLYGGAAISMVAMALGCVVYLRLIRRSVVPARAA